MKKMVGQVGGFCASWGYSVLHFPTFSKSASDPLNPIL